MLTFQMRREQIIRQQKDDADAADVARMAAGGKTKGHPSDLIELADRIADVRRNSYEGPVSNKQRDMVAAGLPVGELTNRQGKSVITRADYCLKAA